MIDQTIEAPAVIPWGEVETLVKAGLSVQSIVDRMGIPNEFERVKKQVTRKGWIRTAPAATLNAATNQLQTVRNEIVPNVPSATEILSQSGIRTKNRLASVVEKAATRLDECDPDDLLTPSVADVAAKYTGMAAKVHGWDAEGRGGAGSTVVNIAFLAPPAHDDGAGRVLIELEGKDSQAHP